MHPVNETPTWLRLTRRELIRALIGLATLLPAAAWLARPLAASGSPGLPPALGPFLDTLLPEDETPGATQLGVHEEIARFAQDNPRFGRLIVVGCLWLDQQADLRGAAEFAEMDAAQRESVVRELEQSPPRSAQWAFFSGTLSLARGYYYAHPETWSGLGYSGPPQPRGFMDYATRPEVSGG